MLSPEPCSGRDGKPTLERCGIHRIFALALHFEFDRTTERAAELNALIRQANASRAKDEE